MITEGKPPKARGTLPVIVLVDGVIVFSSGTDFWRVQATVRTRRKNTEVATNRAKATDLTKESSSKGFV